jgi:DNA-binding transcriptional ArsR family regulator
LPTQWIERKRLTEFTWVKGQGGSQIAALITLIAVAHRTDEEGIARMTYDEIEYVTGLSRATVAAGLDVLEARGLLIREPEGQSTYRLADFKLVEGWAKLPAKGLYDRGALSFAQNFGKRSKGELFALKLYLLFVSRRDRKLNLALLNYTSITEYTGLQRHQIKQGLSVLALNGLVHVERMASWESKIGKASAYRLTHLDSYRHRGTTDIDQILEAGTMGESAE